MNDVITSMLDLFGVNVVPTDFPTFIFWLCSLLAGIEFLRFCVGTAFSFLNKSMEVGR